MTFGIITGWETEKWLMLQLYFQLVSIAKPVDGSHIDIRTTLPTGKPF